MVDDGERRRRFERLARAHGDDLYRYALWICGQEALARDLVQETFLRAWKAFDALREDAAARGWLVTILRREYARTFERKVPPLVDVDALSVAEEREPGRTTTPRSRACGGASPRWNRPTASRWRCRWCWG